MADYAHKIILATPDFQTFRRPWIVSHSRHVFKKSKNFHKVDQLEQFLVLFFVQKQSDWIKRFMKIQDSFFIFRENMWWASYLCCNKFYSNTKYLYRLILSPLHSTISFYHHFLGFKCITKVLTFVLMACNLCNLNRNIKWSQLKMKKSFYLLVISVHLKLGVN